MNFVDPIRNPTLVEDIANYIKKNNERNYILFMCGIYTGLRISDILSLKISDVKNKNYISLKEQKTKKQKTFKINPILKKELINYTYDKDPDDYLIKSRETYNKPLTRSMAYKILQKAAEKFSLERIGCHTLRKTFGYHFYQQTKDIVTLMKIFNHSHHSVTLRYIGIEQENINNALEKFKIY